MPQNNLKHGGLAAILAMAGATQAHADLRVTFDEGAPKDRFQIENTSACTIEDSQISLDLSTSAAGLVFDVTDQGAGVEVFQPFRLTAGAQSLSSVPTVLDGQSEITLNIASLSPGVSIAFTIDVDDTLGKRAITVSGSEIEGATVTYTGADGTTSSVFSSLAQADVAIADCSL